MSKWGRTAVPDKRRRHLLTDCAASGVKAAGSGPDHLRERENLFPARIGKQGRPIRSSDERSVMGLERRDGDHIHCRRHNPKGDDVTDATKSFEIPKALVWASYLDVRRNKEPPDATGRL